MDNDVVSNERLYRYQLKKSACEVYSGLKIKEKVRNLYRCGSFGCVGPVSLKVDRYGRVFVKLEDTIKGFKGILDGLYDDVPEQAFYMVGTIEDALKKAEGMKAA